MDTPICKNCTHYHQHYILDDQRCAAVNCGHCTYPRLKHREQTHPGCTHFQPRATPCPLPDRGQVIHFLTTDLLQYILSLDLPPEQAPEADIGTIT